MAGRYDRQYGKDEAFGSRVFNRVTGRKEFAMPPEAQIWCESGDSDAEAQDLLENEPYTKKD